MFQRRARTGREKTDLVIEEKNQIDAAPLNAAEGISLRGVRYVRGRSLQTQEARELVLEDELGRLFGAEPLTQPDERALGNLLPDGDARAKPVLARRLNLELVE